MTQRNIDVMDIIVSKMAEGAKFSKALKLVYTKRKVCIPYNAKYRDVSLMDLGMGGRTTNSLFRGNLKTIGDVVSFCGDKKITDIVNLGKSSGVELFEAILDYCWAHMSKDERTEFLIDTVERNSEYIKADIV